MQIVDKDGNIVFDDVVHPQHYTQGSIECLDAIKAMLSPDEFKGYLKGNMLKYLWRSPYKESETQDIEKLNFYCNKLMEELNAVS